MVVVAVTVIVAAVLTVMVVFVAVSIIAFVISRMPASVITAFTKGQTGKTQNKNTHNDRDIFFHV